MKDTMRRLREALEDHFGQPHMMSVGEGEDLFAGEADDTGLGGERDRREMLICIELEFGIWMPDTAAVGVVTLSDLVEVIDATLACGDPYANR